MTLTIKAKTRMFRGIFRRSRPRTACASSRSATRVSSRRTDHLVDIWKLLPVEDGARAMMRQRRNRLGSISAHRRRGF